MISGDCVLTGNEIKPDPISYKSGYVTENHGVGGSIPPLGTNQIR